MLVHFSLTVKSGVESGQSLSSFLFLLGCMYEWVPQLSCTKLKDAHKEQVCDSSHVLKLPAFLKLCLNLVSFISYVIILESEM